MIGFIMEANKLLRKNGITNADISTYEGSCSRGWNGIETIGLTDGRVLHFSRKGWLKKEKKLTRKQLRSIGIGNIQGINQQTT